MAAAISSMGPDEAIEIARQLRDIVAVVRGSPEPVSCHDIEMACGLSCPTATKRMKMLVDGNILERERKPRIRKGNPVWVPTCRFKLSADFKACRVEFYPELLAVGIQPKRKNPRRSLGPVQKAILNELQAGPMDEEELRGLVNTRYDKHHFRKTLVLLADRGLLHMENNRWRLII